MDVQRYHKERRHHEKNICETENTLLPWYETSHIQYLYACLQIPLSSLFENHQIPLSGQNSPCKVVGKPVKWYIIELTKYFGGEKWVIIMPFPCDIFCPNLSIQLQCLMLTMMNVVQVKV